MSAGNVDPHRGKVILATFAGRRDRMELLTWYAREALKRGIIDEWHVWDFTRNAADAAWLRSLCPNVRRTPGEGEEYFDAHLHVDVGAEKTVLDVSVSGSTDIHIGLERVSGAGHSYEIVIGGWKNTRSAIRAYATPTLLTDVASRTDDRALVDFRETPAVLPQQGFVRVEVVIGPDGLQVLLDGQEILHHAGTIDAGRLKVLHRSGFGCDAEWDFKDWGKPEYGYLFLSGRPYPAWINTIPRYLSFYQHYAWNQDKYARDVFLKCDDDIVYLDLEALPRFIQFRRDNPGYFMISANVVNNGVCAHYQQEAGIIPTSYVELELPHRGFQGSLWLSPVKAGLVHNHFLDHPERYTAWRHDPIPWNERISINLVAMLGSDMLSTSDIMFDDEEYMSYQGRWRSGKPNALYPGFTVAHLSFYSQDESLDIPGLLDRYRKLARHALSTLAPTPARTAAPAVPETGRSEPRAEPAPAATLRHDTGDSRRGWLSWGKRRV